MKHYDQNLKTTIKKLSLQLSTLTYVGRNKRPPPPNVSLSRCIGKQ